MFENLAQDLNTIGLEILIKGLNWDILILILSLDIKRSHNNLVYYWRFSIFFFLLLRGGVGRLLSKNNCT